MKKKYEKPALIIESFQLDATVAASCSSQGYIPINYAEDTCSLKGQYFNSKNCQMDLTGPNGDGNDTLCYHGPVITGGLTFVAS